MDKTHTRHSLRAAFGITMMVLLLAGGAVAVPVDNFNITKVGHFGGKTYAVLSPPGIMHI